MMTGMTLMIKNMMAIGGMKTELPPPEGGGLLDTEN